MRGMVEEECILLSGPSLNQVRPRPVSHLHNERQHLQGLHNTVVRRVRMCCVDENLGM